MKKLFAFLALLVAWLAAPPLANAVSSSCDVRLMGSGITTNSDPWNTSSAYKVYWNSSKNAFYASNVSFSTGDFKVAVKDTNYGNWDWRTAPSGSRSIKSGTSVKLTESGGEDNNMNAAVAGTYNVTITFSGSDPTLLIERVVEPYEIWDFTSNSNPKAVELHVKQASFDGTTPTGWDEASTNMEWDGTEKCWKATFKKGTQSGMNFWFKVTASDNSSYTYNSGYRPTEDYTPGTNIANVITNTNGASGDTYITGLTSGQDYVIKVYAQSASVVNKADAVIVAAAAPRTVESVSLMKGGEVVKENVLGESNAWSVNSFSSRSGYAFRVNYNTGDPDYYVCDGSTVSSTRNLSNATLTQGTSSSTFNWSDKILAVKNLYVTDDLKVNATILPKLYVYITDDGTVKPGKIGTFSYDGSNYFVNGVEFPAAHRHFVLSLNDNATSWDAIKADSGRYNPAEDIEATSTPSAFEQRDNDGAWYVAEGGGTYNFIVDWESSPKTLTAISLPSMTFSPNGGEFEGTTLGVTITPKNTTRWSFTVKDASTGTVVNGQVDRDNGEAFGPTTIGNPTVKADQSLKIHWTATGPAGSASGESQAFTLRYYPTLTGLYIVKDGVETNILSAKAYKYTGLQGTEKFTVKAEYDGTTTKTYTKGTGTALVEGSTGFALDPNYVEAKITVTVDAHGVPTGYTVSETVNYAVTTPSAPSPVSGVYTVSTTDNRGATLYFKPGSKRASAPAREIAANQNLTAGVYNLVKTNDAAEAAFTVDPAIAHPEVSVDFSGLNLSDYSGATMTINDPDAVPTYTIYLDVHKVYQSGGLWSGTPRFHAWNVSNGNAAVVDNQQMTCVDPEAHVWKYTFQTPVALSSIHFKFNDGSRDNSHASQEQNTPQNGKVYVLDWTTSNQPVKVDEITSYTEPTLTSYTVYVDIEAFNGTSGYWDGAPKIEVYNSSSTTIVDNQTMNQVIGKQYIYKYTFSTSSPQANLRLKFNDGNKTASHISDEINNVVNKRLYKLNWNGTGNAVKVEGTSDDYAEVIDAYMPLSKKNFGEGKVHYFLVGSRQGDWHLQPEWEFEKVDDDTYVISDRYMYNGMIGIAKVTTYEDYATQQFELFVKMDGSAGYTFTKDNLSTTGMVSKGMKQGHVNYDVEGRKFNNDYGTAMWCGIDGNNDLGDTNKGEPNDLINGAGAFVETITLTLSGGNPAGLRFSEPNPEGKSGDRIFQLVGENIGNENLSTLAPGKVTPISTLESGYHKAWEQAYIQYDDDGTPYYDGNGQFIYQTVYQKSWFDDHKTMFYTNNNGGTAFTSDDITFINVADMDEEELADDPYATWYRAFSKHEFSPTTKLVQVKNNDTDAEPTFKYNETLTGDDSGRTPNEGSDWQCYVVKDAWISGEFKIWCGMGGTIAKTENYCGDKTDVRWNGPNAGPTTKTAVNGYDLYNDGGTLSNVLVYASAKNSGKDNNYQTATVDGSDEHFYNRIILWYDGKINNAVIQFITEEESPQIKAKANGSNQIDYNWSVTNAETSTKVVKSYKIERYRVEKGAESINKVVTNVAYSDEKLLSALNAEVSGTTFNDTGIIPGTYFYKVTIEYTDGSSKTARSNRVTLYDAEANKVYPTVYSTQLLELTQKGMDQLNLLQSTKDAIAAAHTKTYLTFNSSYTGKYFLINPSGNRSYYSESGFMTVNGNREPWSLSYEVARNEAGHLEVDAVVTLPEFEGKVVKFLVNNGSDAIFGLTYNSTTGHYTGTSPDNTYSVGDELMCRPYIEGAGGILVPTSMSTCTIGAGHDRIEIYDVNDTEAARIVTRQICDDNGNPYYYWTSDYYVRVLDATAFDRKMDNFREKGQLNQETNPVPVITVYEGDNSAAAIPAVKSTIAKGETDGQAFYGVIVNRHGDLSTTKFTANMTYTVDMPENPTAEQTAAHTRNTQAVQMDVTPTLPNPYTYSYLYTHSQPEKDMEEEFLGKKFAKVRVPSSVKKGATCDVLMPLAQLDPRSLDCVLQFKRPNISREILNHYDIYYTVNIASSNPAKGTISGSGVYYDTDQVAGQSSSGDLTGYYQFNLSNVDPRNDYYPVFSVAKTEYKLHGSTDDGLVANFRSPLAVTAKNNATKLNGSILNVYLGYLEPGKTSYFHTNTSIDKLDWMYKGHMEMYNSDDVHDTAKKDPRDLTPENVVLAPKFFMIETYYPGELDNAYACYEYLVKHDSEHQKNGVSWTSTVMGTNPDGDIVYEPVLNDVGAIAGDTDPLIYTFIAKGFPKKMREDDTSKILKPNVCITPVYIFDHSVSGESTGDERTATAVNLSKVGGSAPAGVVRHNAPVMRDMGNGSGGLDPDPSLAQPMLHINNTNMNASNIHDLTSNTDYVAVAGGPADTKDSEYKDNTTTGIENVAYGVNNGEVEYYTIQGVKVENPMPGQVYIVKQGSQVSKQLFK